MQSQVMTNLEGKRRKYDLVDVARSRGFIDVKVIDDDLGRSASRIWCALGSIAWSHGCAGARSAPFYVSMHPGSRETVAIGITGLNYVGLSKPASSISTAFKIGVGRPASWHEGQHPRLRTRRALNSYGGAGGAKSGRGGRALL